MFKFYNFKTVNSTNAKAKELAKKGISNLVVAAQKQTRGRGRFGRRWSSGLGGLYITISLKEKNLDKAKFLTFIASISVVKTIKKLAKINALIKWPNDILINNKKICGILTETISGKNNYALIGIGININQQTFNRNISNKSISLKIITNKNQNIKKIINEIVKEFNNLYQYYKHKNYGKIISVWKKHSHTLGKKVKIKTLSGTYIGKAVDIDEACNLILKLDDGGSKKVVEGDIFTV